MPHTCEPTRTRPGHGPWRIPRLGPGGPVTALLVAAALLVACEEQVVTPARVVTVEVLPAEITLLEGETTAVSVVAKERGGREVSGRLVAWLAEDPGIATVTSDGLVEARTPGTTRIHATVEGIAGTATVTVLADIDEPGPGPCEYRNRTFPGDVVIAAGVRCTFTDVRIRGDLELRSNSTVIAVDLRVDGNIEGKSASGLTLASSRVDGDIQFEKGGNVQIRQSDIDGNIQLESNDGSLVVEGNTVEGNVQVFKNRGGPFTISDNGIDGDLQCKDNQPAPTGGGNTVDGDKEDQCRSL